MSAPELRELQSILAILREAERIEDHNDAKAAYLRSHARERLELLVEESR